MQGDWVETDDDPAYFRVQRIVRKTRQLTEEIIRESERGKQQANARCETDRPAPSPVSCPDEPERLARNAVSPDHVLFLVSL